MKEINKIKEQKYLTDDLLKRLEIVGFVPEDDFTKDKILELLPKNVMTKKITSVVTIGTCPTCNKYEHRDYYASFFRMECNKPRCRYCGNLILDKERVLMTYWIAYHEYVPMTQISETAEINALGKFLVVYYATQKSRAGNNLPYNNLNHYEKYERHEKEEK